MTWTKLQRPSVAKVRENGRAKRLATAPRRDGNARTPRAPIPQRQDGERLS